MPQIRVDLDSETYARLQEVASAERRPLGWQAEVLLRRALGLPFPYPGIIDVAPEPVSDELRALPAG